MYKIYTRNFCWPNRHVPKILLIMKLTVIIMIVSLMQVSAATFGQNVTLKEKRVSLDKVFKEMMKQTGYEIFLSAKNVDLSTKINVDLTNVPLLKAIEKVLAGLPFTYTIEQETVVIKEVEKNIVDKVKDYFSQIDVSGRVVDKEGMPLPGATIKVKGTSIFISANENGEFFLKNVNERAVLEISFVGYKTIELSVKAQLGNIAMDILTGDLNEVTVSTGYWTTTMKLSTGNISKITSEDIKGQPVLNPLQAMQGRMPGVYVQQNTGIPGGGFSVQIRGRNSLRTGAGTEIDGNLPLYIIDGVPFTSTSLTSPYISGSNLRSGNPLSTINPNDIENIEVLKDADATAIYGSKGANGVVLITTKKAKPGRVAVTADFNQGVGQVSKYLNLLSTQEYIAMRKEAFKNDGANPTNTNAPDLLLWDNLKYTDWQKELIGGAAKITNAQVSFSGGGNSTQFLFSGSYYKEGTVFKGNNSFVRGSSRLSITHMSDDKKFKLSTAINYSTSNSNIPSSDLTAQAVLLAPNAPALYNDNGTLNWQNSTWSNPLAILERKYKSEIGTLVANANLSYELFPGLMVKSGLGFTSMDVKELRTTPLSSYDPQNVAGRTGASIFGDGQIKTWIIEPQIDYSRRVGKGTFSFLIGSSLQRSLQTGKAIEGNGYTSDGQLENLSAATSSRIAENSYSDYKYTGIYARLNYNLDERYIVNLTARRDGSSRFGPGKRFAKFGAIGAGWIFSKERFFDTQSILSFGKLRVSYGTTGSDAIGNYGFLDTYSPTPYPYGGSSGLALSRLVNPDYSWEINKKMEFGLELSFLKDKINFSGSFYLNRSTNQLVGLPLPVITGQSSVQFNLPATVQNKGWEFLISSEVLKGKRFHWSTSLNLTIPSNKLIEFPDLEKFPAYSKSYDIGKSIYLYKRLKFNRVDPQTGLYTFTDLNSDGLISMPIDYIGLKKRTQTFYGGLSNSLRYDNFKLDFFFQFVKQSGGSYLTSFGTPGTLSNQPYIVMDRWQQANDNTQIQRFSAVDPTATVGTAYNNNISSDHFVTDASFIRLKNVSLSYQLPLKWAQKAKLGGTRIFILGQNLFTITKYIGLDPETQFNQTLPSLRILSAGINISL
jgi:TonB-linked SusC/RagA family outer membrane protein